VAEDVASGNLAELVDRAIDGEVVVITRDGKPVVTLLPATDPVEPEAERRNVATNREAIQRLREYARKHPVPNLSHDEIKSWIEEGRS
jgi:prevent-host-death family protein